MPKKAQTLKIEEVPGAKYPDLATAQRAALPSISESMKTVIHELLKRGDLVQVDNRIIPNPQG